jgi:hypothetical protein
MSKKNALPGIQKTSFSKEGIELFQNFFKKYNKCVEESVAD